jgi:hypothetical protein
VHHTRLSGEPSPISTRRGGFAHIAKAILLDLEANGYHIAKKA